MIQIGNNARFIATFLGIVTIIAWALTLFVAGVLNASNVLTAASSLGVATFVSYLGLFVLNSFLWHRWPFSTLLGVPDFRGRWEGWYYSDAHGKWRPVATEITQKAIDLVVHAWGPHNWSRGLCASIVTDRAGTVPQIIWSHKTESTSPIVDAGANHSGTHFLRLSPADATKPKMLEGYYINDRVRPDNQSRGYAGYVKLVWVSRACKNGLEYSDQTWGMPKPEEDPIQTSAT
jgi:hypothetical protein